MPVTQRIVNCLWFDNQAEEAAKLTPGGDPTAQICGWLKDKYGLSWQVVPAILPELAKDHTSPGAQRVMETILRSSKKLNIAELQRAAAG